MSDFVFNGRIIGDGHQFGDNYFNDPQHFIKDANRKFSDTEKELIELIFDNFQSEQEKRELLESLIKLSDDPEKNISEAPVWKRFIKQLTELGLKEAASTVIDYAKSLIPEITANTSAQQM